MTAHEGVVITAPATTSDLLHVAIPAFDDEQGDFLRWMPRGTTLPQPGDPCLIVTTSTGEAWVPAWWPPPMAG